MIIRFADVRFCFCLFSICGVSKRNHFCVVYKREKLITSLRYKCIVTFQYELIIKTKQRSIIEIDKVDIVFRSVKYMVESMVKL